MKHILIVDDQSLNQTLLKAYINKYSDESGEEIAITMANNGVEAVSLCEASSFDLVFMDILMPAMDGIEATKHIHAILPNAIIVIVSTEGDEENQILALRNGAKDYFVKPIQGDVFKHRLGLYIAIMNSHKEHIVSKQSINPFTNAIFCYKTTYLIETEEDLAQLWESLLNTIKDSVRTNFLSDLIRFTYQLGQMILQRKVQPQIILEENETSYFFSILNINIIPSQKIIHQLESYLGSSEYHLSSNLLSFSIRKESVCITQKESASPLQQESPPSSPSQPDPVSDNVVYHKQAETLQKFDFMEDEDLISLELRLGELATQFMWMGSNELNRDDVDQIISSFEKTSSILMLYSQTQTLGIAIRELTAIIQKDEKTFIQMAPQMSALCKSFNNDLIIWFRSVFYEGAPSIDFMDASIISNIQMVQSFLEPASEESFDEGEGFEFF